jgi:uncharacterized cupredoxin-like copper-binding protein
MVLLAVARLRLLALGAGASALLLFTGCGGAARADSGAVVRVSERDFGITASPHEVSPGTVVIRVANHGPDRHELIVVRVRGKGGLPLRSDGMTINEEALQRAEVGVLEPGAPGSVRDLRVNLSAGRYVLFCNMSGHYMGGMHTMVVVR